MLLGKCVPGGASLAHTVFVDHGGDFADSLGKLEGETLAMKKSSQYPIGSKSVK